MHEPWTSLPSRPAIPKVEAKELIFFDNAVLPCKSQQFSRKRNPRLDTIGSLSCEAVCDISLQYVSCEVNGWYSFASPEFDEQEANNQYFVFFLFRPPTTSEHQGLLVIITLIISTRNSCCYRHWRAVHVISVITRIACSFFLLWFLFFLVLVVLILCLLLLLLVAGSVVATPVLVLHSSSSSSGVDK